MKKLSYCISDSTDPYYNIALEEYLLKHVEVGECILYLWQNHKTVVLGYNQNPWRECKVETLETDGGHVARRLSGGGAVFHDLGNLNFTFLVRQGDYNVKHQSEVILKAVQSFGIPAIKNGRNDLTVEGRKFSGNAFYRTGDFCYHHGTILIDADTKEMGKYLTVSKEKLLSKGVESVKSRVVNLKEYAPELTVKKMKKALWEAFNFVYGEGRLRPMVLAADRICEDEIKKGQERFASWDWLYGRKIPFQFEASGKYPWGEVQIQLVVSQGIIQQVVIWSDALDAEFPRQMERLLTGVRYKKQDLESLFQKQQGETQEQKQIQADVISCVIAGC